MEVVPPTPLLTRLHSPCNLFVPMDGAGFEMGAFCFAEIQRESLAALDSISVEDFRQCFEQWEHCKERCVQSQGQYFEGD